MISPTLLLNAGVPNDAIALPYIQSRADLSELMAIFRFVFEARGGDL